MAAVRLARLSSVGGWPLAALFVCSQVGGQPLRSSVHGQRLSASFDVLITFLGHSMHVFKLKEMSTMADLEVCFWAFSDAQPQRDA